MKNQLKKWAGCLCAPVGVGLAGMLLWPAGHVLLWVVGLAVALAGSLTFFRQRDRRFQVCFGILGTLFVLATALGRCLTARPNRLAECWLALGCLALLTDGITEPYLFTDVYAIACFCLMILLSYILRIAKEMK